MGEVKEEAARTRLIRVMGGLHHRVPSVILHAALVSKFPKRARRSRRRLVNFISRVRFSHLKMFACSPRRSAPTTAVPSRITRRIGRSEHSRVVRLRRRVSCSGKASHVKRRLLIVVRKGITSRDTCVNEACKSTPGISNCVFIRAKRLLVAKSFTGMHIANTLRCSLVKRLTSRCARWACDDRGSPNSISYAICTCEPKQ